MSKSKVPAPAGLVYRGSVPYFRLRIAQQLQATFGKREIKQSLGRIAHEEAKREARRLSVEWEGRFAEAQRVLEARLAPPPARLTEQDRARYWEAWLRYWLADDEAQRSKVISREDHEAGIDIGRDLLYEARERLVRGDTSETEVTLRRWSRSAGFDVAHRCGRASRTGLRPAQDQCAVAHGTAQSLPPVVVGNGGQVTG